MNKIITETREKVQGSKWSDGFFVDWVAAALPRKAESTEEQGDKIHLDQPDDL